MKPGQKPLKPRKQAADTGWEPVSGWYGGHLKEEGSLLKDVAYPAALELLAPKSGGRYLDIACGEGSFSRRLIVEAKDIHVSGFDASPTLIQTAKKLAPPRTAYAIADARAFSKLYPAASFDGATCILAIQNVDKFEAVFSEAAKVLKPGGSLVLVMNHPAFRIPKATSWGYEGNKAMYRRIDRYLSPMEFPIAAHPGSDPSVKTSSYHRPLKDYVNVLSQQGFAVVGMREPISNRESKPGARANAENLSRQEIPLFLAIRAEKR